MNPIDYDSLRARLAALPHATDSAEPGDRAAVSAVIRSHPAHGAELLFIRRAEHPLDPWSGHMAFPGGRREPHDPDLSHTALRETLEEVGLDLRRDGALLTRLDDVPAIARGERMGLVIAPFVCALDRPAETVTQPEEVAETLWVPLSTLAAGEGEGLYAYHHKGTDLQLPCIRLGDRVVWGLTYFMLQTLLQVAGLKDSATSTRPR